MSDKQHIAIVCGSRSITDYDAVREAIERTGWDIYMVVHGDAPGVDRLAAKWAEENGALVNPFPIEEYANNDTGGLDPTAGPRRNRAMAAWVDYHAHSLDWACCIAVWDGESAGTMDMVRRARKRGMKVSIYEPHRERNQVNLFGGVS